MQAPARATTIERRGIGHRRRRRALVTTGLNVHQHGLGGGGPPCRPTTTATAPSTPELHAPPSCPEAAARIGPHRPRSGPTAMRGHGRGRSPRAAASTACPSHRHHAPSLRFHTPPRRREPPPLRHREPPPPPRSTALKTSCHGRGAPPPSSVARALPGHVLRRRRGREGEGLVPTALGLALQCRPSGGDTGGERFSFYCHRFFVLHIIYTFVLRLKTLILGRIVILLFTR
jgi:hypothetical protein